jgi:hypothetical protein
MRRPKKSRSETRCGAGELADEESGIRKPDSVKNVDTPRKPPARRPSWNEDREDGQGRTPSSPGSVPTVRPAPSSNHRVGDHAPRDRRAVQRRRVTPAIRWVRRRRAFR